MNTCTALSSRSWHKRIATVLMAATCLGLASRSQAEIVDRVGAIVGTEVITQSDVDRRLAFHVSELRSIASPQEKTLRLQTLQRSALDELIQDKLLEREVAKSDIVISDQDLAGAIGRMLKENGISLEQLKNELKSNNVSFETYKENLSNQLKQYKFLQRTIGSQIQITEADSADYYRQHATDFQSYGAFRFSQIVLTAKANRDLNETIVLANSLKAQVESKTARFADLAQTYSEDNPASGDAPWVSARDINPQLIQVLSSLSPGTVSPPLPTQDAVLLVQLIDRKDPQASSLDAVKREVEARLFQEKMDAALNRYLLGLRETAYVQILGD